MSNSNKGIGIGLSTADSLAGALGGRVFVTSSQYLGNQYRTEVLFKIKLTNVMFLNSYAADLGNKKTCQQSEA